jgi:hypothetical protein
LANSSMVRDRRGNSHQIDGQDQWCSKIPSWCGTGSSLGRALNCFVDQRNDIAFPLVWASSCWRTSNSRHWASGGEIPSRFAGQRNLIDFTLLRTSKLVWDSKWFLVRDNSWQKIWSLLTRFLGYTISAASPTDATLILNFREN